MLATLEQDFKPARFDLWCVALYEATRLAVAKYPQGGERMVKGYSIALEGKVTLLDPGHAEVASQFGSATYILNGARCPCMDSRKQPTLVCKHRFAKALATKATALLDAAVQDAMGGEPGDECPQCGYPTVVIRPLYSKQRQSFDDFMLCRFVLRLGEVSYGCGWGTSVHAL